MRAKYILAIMLAAILMASLTNFAIAQSSPPAPYTGLQNPFDWNDAQVQAAGKNIYQQTCSGCHGATGNGVAEFDFGSPAFPQQLEAQPDFYFWVLSEGRLAEGMPPYKSNFSIEQRWQTLTYMHSLSSAPQVPGTPQPSVPPTQASSLTLMVSQEALTGQNLAFTAVLKDNMDKPLPGAVVQFYLTEDFFTKGRMDIGQATTDAQGQAILNYVLKIAGEQTLIAKYQTLESDSKINILDSGQNFYQAEAGIRFQSVGPEVFIGPGSSHELGEMGNAPQPALRLPGGIFSWLWLYIGVVALVWGIYFVVMIQILKISGEREYPGRGAKPVSLAQRNSTRLIPLVGLAVILGLGLIIVAMIITGPYSHFHVAP